MKCCFCCCCCYCCCRCCSCSCCCIIVVVDPTSPLLKFGQNQVRNSWDINDIEFVVVVGDGWWNKVVFVSNLTFELSWLSWGCDNFLNQNFFGRNFFLPKSFMDPILLVLKFWDMDCFLIEFFFNPIVILLFQ